MILFKILSIICLLISTGLIIYLLVLLCAKKENFTTTTKTITTSPPITCVEEHRDENIQIYDFRKLSEYKEGDLVRDHYWVLRRNNKKYVKPEGLDSLLLVTTTPSVIEDTGMVDYWDKVNRYFTLGKRFINTYPFIGSHDSATGSDIIITREIPIVATQDKNFMEQYNKGGVRFFDLRCKIYRNNLIFAHGPVPLQTVDEDISLLQMIKKVIRDKDLIILYITSEGDDSYINIIKKWKEYIVKNNLDRNTVFFKNTKEFSTCVNYYVNRDLNILIVPKKNDDGNLLVDDLWNNNFSSQKCFRGENFDINDLFGTITCRRDSCLGKDHKYWDEFWNVLNKNLTNYRNNTKPSKLVIMQAFWQAPTDFNGAEQAVRCLLDTNNFRTAVNTERQSFMNSKIYKFFYEKRRILPNIIIFDNVNECTRKLNLLFTSNFKYPDSSRCLSYGQHNHKCERNIECENDSCGRKDADTDKYICCPTDGLVSEFASGFKDYCARMPSGTSCWIDGQCSSNDCKTPWYQFNIGKGTCT